MCILHDFTNILISVTVQDVEPTAQDVEFQVMPLNLKAIPIGDFVKGRLVWNIHGFILNEDFFLCVSNLAAIEHKIQFIYECTDYTQRKISKQHLLLEMCIVIY